MIAKKVQLMVALTVIDMISLNQGKEPAPCLIPNPISIGEHFPVIFMLNVIIVSISTTGDNDTCGFLLFIVRSRSISGCAYNNQYDKLKSRQRS